MVNNCSSGWCIVSVLSRLISIALCCKKKKMCVQCIQTKHPESKKSSASHVQMPHTAVGLTIFVLLFL